MERIYILQGEEGLFKVGRTGNFPRRLLSLRSEFKRRGDVVARHHVFDEIRHGYLAEAHMMEWLNEVATRAAGREWFRGVDFSAALERGAKFTKQTAKWVPWGFDWTPAQQAKWDKESTEQELRYQEGKRQRLAVMAAYEERRRRDRRLKAHGLYSFEAIVSALARAEQQEA